MEIKKIKGNLILKEDFKFNVDLIVEGDIKCEGGIWNITCNNIDCNDIECWNINCRDINCNNLDCCDINCNDIKCDNINCDDINSHDINCNNLDCWNIYCRDINCRDIKSDKINCRDINCCDIKSDNINCNNLDCCDINCWDIKCNNLDCNNLSFYTSCVAYNSLKCKSAKGRRKNFILKCLDEEIDYRKEIKNFKKGVNCDKCNKQIFEKSLIFERGLFLCWGCSK